MNIRVKYIFAGIWAALIALLFGMFALAHFHLGGAGTAIILSMAVMQTLLVLTFFMRLRHGTTIVRLAAGVGFFWLLILFVLAFSDYLTRQWH